MKAFMNEDFPLGTETAKRLLRDIAEGVSRKNTERYFSIDTAK